MDKFDKKKICNKKDEVPKPSKDEEDIKEEITPPQSTENNAECKCVSPCVCNQIGGRNAEGVGGGEGSGINEGGKQITEAKVISKFVSF